jgi:lysophospholipase L1-like esterase
MLEGLFERITGKRSDTPDEFLRMGGRGSAVRTLVVCAGDSITHGSASANYVDLLKRRWTPRGYAFVNAGINGNLAWNVLQRLDPMIACRPDVVTLLIGTNDVNATLDEKWTDSYRKEQSLPRDPELAWYRDNVAAILDRLAAETTARVLVLEIPMLGEDLSSEMNTRVDEYNEALRRLCAERSVPLLPLHDRLAALLPAGVTPPLYTGDRNVMARSIMGHMLLRRGWDDVSRRNGLSLLTDHIHLNDRAASVVADLISESLADG